MMLAYLILTLIGAADGWSYADPAVWRQFYPECDGNSQSPINLYTKSVHFDRGLLPFKFENYTDAEPKLLKNDYHTIQLNLDFEATMSEGGLTGDYKPLQLHFHWSAGQPDHGSEHTVDGKTYPLEMHIVHVRTAYLSVTEALKQPDGLAVLGFFFQISDSDNTNLKEIVDLAGSVNETGTNIDGFSLGKLIKIDGSGLKDFYRYNGSLTTPPCSEAVVWTIFNTPLEISKKQLESIWKGGYNSQMMSNYRPVQPLNHRKVLASFLSSSGMSKAVKELKFGLVTRLVPHFMSTILRFFEKTDLINLITEKRESPLDHVIKQFFGNEESEFKKIFKYQTTKAVYNVKVNI